MGSMLVTCDEIAFRLVCHSVDLRLTSARSCNGFEPPREMTLGWSAICKRPGERQEFLLVSGSHLHEKLTIRQK